MGLSFVWFNPPNEHVGEWLPTMCTAAHVLWSQRL